MSNKIFQIVPNTIPRLVQVVDNQFYDGDGNLLADITGLAGGGGVQGPQGSGGVPSILNSTFSSANIITITHSFGYYPVVQVLDQSYNLVTSFTVSHNSINDYTITFATSSSGLIITGAGTEGVQGTTGVQGFQGPQGITGFQGITGPQGVQGTQGSLGGGTGNQGDTGPQGYTGPQGPLGGGTGNQGETGPQGFQGYTGPQGFQGESGPQGFQGGTGPQGPVSSSTLGGVYIMNTTETSATGTAELINKTLLIPANSFTASNAFNITVRIRKDNSGFNQTTTRIYIGATNSTITGAFSFAGFLFPAVSNLTGCMIQRSALIISATNSTSYILPVGSTASTSAQTDFVTGNAITSAIDWTQNQYVIVTTQTNNAGYSAFIRSIQISPQ